MDRITANVSGAIGTMDSTSSGFRNVLLWLASALAVTCLVLDAYIVYKHSSVLRADKALLLPVLIGLQCVNTWVRAVRFNRATQKMLVGISNKNAGDLASTQAVSASVLNGTAEMLFWSFATIALSLVFVDTAFSQ